MSEPIRAVLAIALGAAFGLMWGYGMAIRRHSKSEKETRGSTWTAVVIQGDGHSVTGYGSTDVEAERHARSRAGHKLTLDMFTSLGGEGAFVCEQIAGCHASLRVAVGFASGTGEPRVWFEIRANVCGMGRLLSKHRTLQEAVTAYNDMGASALSGQRADAHDGY